MIGFFCGWFLFLVALFGVIEEFLFGVKELVGSNHAGARDNGLVLMFDIYVLALAALTCVLEMPKSTLVSWRARARPSPPARDARSGGARTSHPRIPPAHPTRGHASLPCPIVWQVRDRLALPLENSLAFLRLAGGRGCVYAAAGFLALDTDVCCTRTLPLHPHPFPPPAPSGLRDCFPGIQCPTPSSGHDVTVVVRKPRPSPLASHPLHTP